MAVSPKSLENLKKGPRFTSETAREAGKRGKRKSDEVKKHKKDMAQLLSVIAEGDIADQEVKDSLAALGFEDEDMQNEALNGEDLTETVKKLVSAVADPIKGRKAETADTKVANIAGGKEAVTTKTKAELIDGLDKE